MINEAFEKFFGHFFKVKCPECNWQGMSNECEGGGPIADTGDYDNIVCPKCFNGGNLQEGKWVPVEEIK